MKICHKFHKKVLGNKIEMCEPPKNENWGKLKKSESIIQDHTYNIIYLKYLIENIYMFKQGISTY